MIYQVFPLPALMSSEGPRKKHLKTYKDHLKPTKPTMSVIHFLPLPFLELQKSQFPLRPRARRAPVP